jgi:RNA polymerase sigma-70 factor (ECF subfamily)
MSTFFQPLPTLPPEEPDLLVDTVADEAAKMSGELDDRHRALLQCLEKLSPEQRQLLHLRYAEGGSIDKVAMSVSKTVQATYRSLSRIRHVLFVCIGRVIAQGEA